MGLGAAHARDRTAETAATGRVHVKRGVETGGRGGRGALVWRWRCNCGGLWAEVSRSQSAVRSRLAGPGRKRQTETDSDSDSRQVRDRQRLTPSLARCAHQAILSCATSCS